MHSKAKGISHILFGEDETNQSRSSAKYDNDQFHVNQVGPHQSLKSRVGSVEPLHVVADEIIQSLTSGKARVQSKHDVANQLHRDAESDEVTLHLKAIHLQSQNATAGQGHGLEERRRVHLSLPNLCSIPNCVPFDALWYEQNCHTVRSIAVEK
jgi:hypothetical protein